MKKLNLKSKKHYGLILKNKKWKVTNWEEPKDFIIVDENNNVIALSHKNKILIKNNYKYIERQNKKTFMLQVKDNNFILSERDN